VEGQFAYQTLGVVSSQDSKAVQENFSVALSRVTKQYYKRSNGLGRNAATEFSTLESLIDEGCLQQNHDKPS
jgi:hypothetical protein